MQPIATSEIPGLAKIKRVVVMMFENRSFDHIFGALPGVNGLFESGQINQSYYNLPDPLNPPSTSNLPVYSTPIDPSLPQVHDFNHDFGDGMMPDLFGPIFTVSGGTGQPDDPTTTYTSGYQNGSLVGQINPTPPTYPATNSGFYSTYRGSIQGQPALTYFEDGDLQVLHTLAKNFVLCDNWHCDMPGHTLPNRNFIHTGRTGVKIDDNNSGNDEHQNIFSLIEPLSPPDYQPSKWRIYVPVDDANVLGQIDTQYLNSNVRPYQGAPITQFETDCQKGNLPFYSFIMCWLPTYDTDAYTDTSMHPNSLIQPGENLLAAVYNTLRSSSHWEDTLLVVTFDENGGIYDHVFPPTTTPPVPEAEAVTQDLVGDCGNTWTLRSTFDFSLLGLRVPALLISPWLAAGIDSHQYQNTSVLRFLIDKMNAPDDLPIGYLTQRDATAPSLDSAFSQYGQTTMRLDCPLWLAPYPTLPCFDPDTNSNAIPYSDGTLTPWTPPSSMLSAKPVPYIKEFLNIYVAPLPGHPDSGKKITRTFATNGDVADYTKERAQAANQFYQTRGTPPIVAST